MLSPEIWISYELIGPNVRFKVPSSQVRFLTCPLAERMPPGLYSEAGSLTAQCGYAAALPLPYFPKKGSTMTSVVVLGPNLMDQSNGSFHVHAAGCADIKRSRAYDSPEFDDDKKYPLDMESVEQIADYVYADIEDDPREYVNDFYVFPCVVFEKEVPMFTVTFELYNADMFLSVSIETKDLSTVVAMLESTPNVRNIRY